MKKEKEPIGKRKATPPLINDKKTGLGCQFHEMRNIPVNLLFQNFFRLDCPFMGLGMPLF